MSESLVVRLGPSPHESACWVVVDQTGALLSPSSRGPLTDATALAAGRQVVVLVPAVDVVRTIADVPVKGSGKLQQALPFALEEQVAEDVDELHFAARARHDGGRVAVAVVRRATLESWLQRLGAAGLRADRMYSEADAIGSTPNTATLLLEEETAVLVDPEGALNTMDAAGWDAVLALWIARYRSTAADNGPIHLVVYGPPGVLSRHREAFEQLRAEMESVDLRQLTDGVLPRLAAQIVTAPGINLLQGDYAERSTIFSYWPAWRLSAALLTAFLVLALVLQIAEVSKLRRELAALDASIDQAFHYVFPDAGPVQDARAQLSSRLRQLGDRNNGAPHEFLGALEVVARAISGNEQARIEAITYRSGTIELRVRAATVEVLDRIQQAVTESGSLQAEIQSANASGEEVVGRLQISRMGG